MNNTQLYHLHSNIFLNYLLKMSTRKNTNSYKCEKVDYLSKIFTRNHVLLVNLPNISHYQPLSIKIIYLHTWITNSMSSIEAEGQRKKGRQKRTRKKQVEEESMKVGLRRKDALCSSMWSVGVDKIAAGLR